MSVMNNEDLPIMYRPNSLGDLIGQDAIVKSLKFYLGVGKLPHSFILHGESGVGKTTTARIIAKKLKCTPNNIMEFDAASFSGVDAMKQLTSNLRFSGLGDCPNRVIIIDECQRLSKNAWDALLKPIEEPFSHIYFILCTTEFNKIPKTIQTRCTNYAFKNAKFDDVCDLLDNINDEEDFGLDDNIIQYIAKQSEGSFRKAVVSLSACRNAESKEDAAEILSTIVDKKDVIELCRHLLKTGGSFKEAVVLVKDITSDGSMPAESIRIIIINYLSAVITRNPGSKSVPGILDIMDSFSTPYNNFDKIAPILLSLGEIYY